LRAAAWLTGTVTVGQAVGGDVEAVTVHSGLLAARRVLDADVAVVTQGPGNLGTGTRWGFSGVASGEAVNAAAVLAGRPIAALRVSEVDPRPRHRGVSHHTLTALGRVALARADVVLPVVPGPFGELIRSACRPLAQRHRLVEVAVDGLADALMGSPAPLSSMGRRFDEDPVYFLAGAAAGRHAASVL
jgi:ribosomal protein L3